MQQHMGLMDYARSSQMGARSNFRSGYDAFESVEWDPELPTSSSPADSPEPVTIRPQPVAYTTVGSLVDPTAIPHFTAPNRIQREGANRRPLLSILRNQQFDTVFQARGPPPPLNMSNSMHYAQTLARSPAHLETVDTSTSDRSSQATSDQPQLTEQEKEILIRQFGDGGEPEVLDTAMLVLNGHELDNIDHVFHVEEKTDIEADCQPVALQGPIQGLEKMQTLQRLSKFANPMQELARTELSKFAVNNARATSRTSNKTSSIPNAYNTTAYDQRFSNALPANVGELNLSFQFPPNVTGSSSRTQNKSIVKDATGDVRPGNYVQSRPQGYPQPLTAGPPGQRSYNSSLSQQSSAQNVVNIQSRASMANQDVEAKNAHLRRLLEQFSISETSAPEPQGAMNLQHRLTDDELARMPRDRTVPIWTRPQELHTQGELTKPHSGYCTTPIKDTISMSHAQKYYPLGFPASFTGIWNQDSGKSNLKMDNGSHDVEGKGLERAEELDRWFYDGQSRFWENSDALFGNAKENLTAKHNFGPIGPAKRGQGAVQRKPLTVTEVEKMSVAECAKPLMAGLYTTLFEYSDRSMSDLVPT